jgi:hypothetical protein
MPMAESDHAYQQAGAASRRRSVFYFADFFCFKGKLNSAVLFKI